MARFARLSGLLLLLCGLVAAAMPWRVPRAALAGALSAGLGRGAGLHAVVAGPVFLKVLPRPRVQATELAVTAEDGSIALDAPVFKAELDIPSLLRGVWRVTAATLVGPTVTVDLDKLAARREGSAPAADAAGGPPAALRLRDGVVRTVSSSGLADGLATDVDLSATWSGGGDDLVVSGTAVARGVDAQFAANVERPALAFAPAGSPATLRLDSPLFSASVDGVLFGGARERIVGRAALGTAALPRLMRALGMTPRWGAVTRAQLSGEVVADARGVSLSDAQIRLDRSRFEGTLAWRQDADRGMVAGTLATDALDLDGLLGARLGEGALTSLYRRPLRGPPLGFDVDLRVSAARARVGQTVLGDAAMALLVRGDRLELTLDEAEAYGGTVKGRALAVFGREGVDAHAEFAAKAIDLAALSRTLSGRAQIGGALTARAAVDGRGSSLGDVVAGLTGDGQITIEGGRLAGLSLSQVLHRLRRRVPLLADRRATPTTFDRASWDVAVEGGVVRIPEGRLTAPGVATSFSAEAALPDGRVAVHAVASETDGAGAPLPGSAAVPFDVRGALAGPLVLAARGAALPSSGVLPLLGESTVAP